MAIHVCPLSRAPDLARDIAASHTISLLDPGTPFPAFEHLTHNARLRVEINDVEAIEDAEHPPHAHHIDAIIAFVRAWDREAPLLVHCYAGISRSTATAFIAACVHNPEADERVIAGALRQASPTASPNRRLVALADHVLARNGRMRAAIDAIGRGPPWHEIGEARPFFIPSRFEAA